MKKTLSTLFIVLALILSFTMIADAITVTINRNIGNTDSVERVRDVTIAMDSSYPTGGESLTIADLALGSAVWSMDCAINDGLTFKYDYTNSKLQAFGVTNGFQLPIAGATKPALTLTHDADPVSNKAAAAVYAVELTGSTSENILSLQSITNGNTDILASFEETTGVLNAGTPRYVVTDSDSPSGVQVYVNTTGDILEFVSPTASDGYIIAPIENIADMTPGVALKIKVHHSATAAADGVVLYFDDNGAADVQLFFVDPGTAGGVIPAADIEVITLAWTASDTPGTMSEVESTEDLSGVTDLKCRVTGK